MWTLLLRNKKLAVIVLSLVLAFVYLGINMKRYAKAKTDIVELNHKIELDSLKILDLQRDILDFVQDTIQYRESIRSSKKGVEKLEIFDKENNKDLSTRPPTIEELKKHSRK